MQSAQRPALASDATANSGGEVADLSDHPSCICGTIAMCYMTWRPSMLQQITYSLQAAGQWLAAVFRYVQCSCDCSALQPASCTVAQEFSFCS